MVIKINYSKIGDFLVDEKYIFEIGGKNKGFKPCWSKATKSHIEARTN